MNKPTVYYIGCAVPVSGDRASLVPINHRNHVLGQCVVNWRPVITSRVVSWDHGSGRIETRHTIYLPCAKPGDEQGLEHAEPVSKERVA